MITLAELTAELLEHKGIRNIFVIPGTPINPLVSCLIKKKIRLINMFHEQALVHAAQGYSEESNQIAVVLVSSGPGITNIATGILNAFKDLSQVFVIGSHISISPINTYELFQEFNPKTTFDNITKASISIDSTYQFQAIFHRAFKICSSHPKGPVLMSVNSELWESEVECLSSKADLESDALSYFNYNQIISDFKFSKKPLIFVGGGINNESGKLAIKELIERTNIPIVSTFRALNLLTCGSKNYLGFGGYCGSERANYAINNCDTILLLGVNINDRNYSHKLVNKVVYNVNLNPPNNSLENSVIQTVKIDAAKFIENFNSNHSLPQAETSWLDEIYSYPILSEDPVYIEELGNFSPISVLHLVKDSLDSSSIVVTDCGQHQLWAAQVLDGLDIYKFFSPGNLGVMGSGLPTAFGFGLANSNGRVNCIIGDGGFLSTIHCIKYFLDYKIDVRIFLFNNNAYGLVRQNQGNSTLTETHANFSTVDFCQIAKSFGMKAIKINKTFERLEFQSLLSEFQFFEFEFEDKFDVILAS